MAKTSFFIWITILFTGLNSFGQVQTIAEKSDFKATSHYNDVLTFIGKLKGSSEYIGVETIAKSSEGRDIPLLIIGNPLPRSPKDLKNDHRVVIYIQANIHADEVEGKEASLMFARDILKEKDSPLLRNVVFLICPIFNADGNEKMSALHRTHQNGPSDGVGVRYNGQNLDINRDAMKAETPEVRGLLTNVFNRWDPSVFMDCHTSNGSYHMEPVTFTWMVNPNGDHSLISYMRGKMMPEMSGTLLNKYKVENVFYGEFFDLMDPAKGWVYDASEPRYITNYFGIRNRLGILNENYVYADFRSRVFGCYYLIKSLAEYAGTHASEIKTLISGVDKKTIERGLNSSPADSFAIEYAVHPLEKMITVKAYNAELVTDTGGWNIYKKGDIQKTITVPYFIDYYAVRSVRLPFAYLININSPDVMSLLRDHGIKLEKLAEDSKIKVSGFEILDLTCAPRLSQGHYLNTVKGRYYEKEMDFPAGTVLVRMAQPLSTVAAYLLEPESDDGLLKWNYFDRYLVPQWGRGYYPYPVFKIMDSIGIKTIPVL